MTRLSIFRFESHFHLQRYKNNELPNGQNSIYTFLSTVVLGLYKEITIVIFPKKIYFAYNFEALKIGRFFLHLKNSIFVLFSY